MAAFKEFAPKEREIEVGVPCLEVTGDTPTGTIVYFFGGGHTVGSPEEDIVITAPMAVDGGARVAVRYPLAPEQPYPAAVDTAEAAYRGVLDEIGDGRGGRWRVCGRKSRPRTHAADPGRRTPLPCAPVLLSPWGDLRRGRQSRDEPRPDPRARQRRTARDGRLYRDAAVDDPVSPVHADRGLPPTFITTGTRDLLSDGVRISAGTGATAST